MAVFLHFTAKTARRKQEIAEASGPSPLFAAGRRFLEKFMDYLFFKCFLLWYNNE